MSRGALLSLALALCACGSDLASPFSAVAVTYDVNKQAFKLAQVRVNSLTSLRHLQGSAGTVTAGGKVRTSSAAVRSKTATVAALRSAFIQSQPAQVQLTWNVLNDIVYPEDFESLELLSTYYNLEKARTSLSDWGLAALPAQPVVAHADLKDENGISPLPEGELYYAPLATFFAPATTAQQQVPPAFNLGAVAHALGHQAVEELVWAGAPAPAPELGPAGDPAWNTARHLARSVTEGLADYLGVAVSDDPRWFDHSLQQDAATRALDQIHCGDSQMLGALPGDDAQAPYDPYPLGSVLAGALWEASTAGVQISARGVLAALPDLGARAAAAQGQLALAVVLDVLVASAAADRKPELCALFVNRFNQLAIKRADLPACAGVAVIDHQECQ